MKIMQNIFKFKDRLTRFNEEEPLSKLALVIILMLDVFILSVVFGGLHAHTKQLTSPHEYFPHACRQVFIDRGWTPANRVDELQRIVLTDYNRYSYRWQKRLDEKEIQKMHPTCRSFFDLIHKMAKDPALKRLFVQRQNLIKQNGTLKQRLGKEQELYNTSLLEKIADSDPVRVETLASSVKRQSVQVDALNAKIQALDQQILRHPLIRQFWALVRIGDEVFRSTMIRDLNRFERFFKFKELLWQLIFMLPLFFIFYIWYTKSIRRQSPIQILVASHLLVIAAIPIVGKIIEVVLELIPFHFFKELFKWLQMLHIIAIWHYIVIFLAIGAALLFVYLVQTKLFNKKRLYLKRMEKGACFSCGRQLPEKPTVCPFCGTHQFKTCPHCQVATYEKGNFCMHCGKRT